MNRAEHLARSNLAYRDPALYDDMLGDDDTADTVARLTARTLGESGHRSVLDLGCGTGRVASTLRASYGWTATGVDVQPGLIAYAHECDPAVRWFTSDIATLRLGETFDVVTSVGNTFAYLHTDDELRAAFHTARLHSAATGLLLIATITTPPPPRHEPQRTDIDTRRGPASVEVRSTWDPLRSLVTTTRIWRFHDAEPVHDGYIRRVWTVEQLREHAEAAGFAPLAAEGLALRARAHVRGR